MKKYTICIIGIGNIAIKPEDIEQRNPEAVTSWCKAISLKDNLKLNGLVDSKYEKAFAAHNRYQASCYESLQQMGLQNCNSDIFIVSTSTEKHYEILTELTQFSPKLVICEKPFTSSLKEAEQIVELYSKLGIPLAVNYLRQYDEEYISIKKSFDTNEFGKIYSCVCYYTRGLVRDGSHFINLANSWFGKYLDGNILQGTDINDYSDQDLTFAANMKFEKCNLVTMIPIDGRKYDIFDIVIHTEFGKLELLDHGNTIRFYEKRDEPIYGNYKSLPSVYKESKANIDKAMLDVLDNCIDYLERKDKLICSGASCLETYKILEDL